MREWLTRLKAMVANKIASNHPQREDARTRLLYLRVDNDLWEHLSRRGDREGAELVRCALAVLKWSLDESAKGYRIGSFVEGSDGVVVKTELRDPAFDRLRAGSWVQI
jgi:hypothetical protein